MIGHLTKYCQLFAECHLSYLWIFVMMIIYVVMMIIAMMMIMIRITIIMIIVWNKYWNYILFFFCLRCGRCYEHKIPMVLVCWCSWQNSSWLILASLCGGCRELPCLTSVASSGMNWVSNQQVNSVYAELFWGNSKKGFVLFSIISQCSLTAYVLIITITS